MEARSHLARCGCVTVYTLLVPWDKYPRLRRKEGIHAETRLVRGRTPICGLLPNSLTNVTLSFDLHAKIIVTASAHSSHMRAPPLHGVLARRILRPACGIRLALVAKKDRFEGVIETVCIVVELIARPIHSALKVTIGSTLVARLAGR
jgi:hypothetical protein